MKYWHRGAQVLVALMLLALVGPLHLSSAQGSFADPAFQRTWERTDKPVADGQANRSWYWGPTPGFATTETYKNAPGGSRLVQYFDKTRMEINNPNGDKTSVFYVTNGLLATELMTGRMQVGDNDFEQRCAADIPLASDNDDATGPTYATFGKLMSAAKVNQVGQKALATTDRAGNISADAGKATVPGVDLVYFDAITQRNVPKIFWEFLNAQGPVYVNGQYSNAQINQPWFFASGLPTTEAYWAKAKIGGQQLDVLVQGFERRVLTYIPAYNGTPFNVQMGNVGQHYYDWRYKNAGCAAPPPPAATPVPPASTPAPTQPPAPPPPSACDLTGTKDGSVNPTSGPAGTEFEIEVHGFQGGETVSYWLTDDHGQVYGSQRTFVMPGSGSNQFFFDSTGVPTGRWAVTFHGLSSNHESIVYFCITGAAPPPPPPPGSCDLNGTKDANVNPTSAKVGAEIDIEMYGFQPNERASYWLTDPDGAVYGVEQTITMNGQGRFGGTLNTQGMYPGRWALTAHGLSSNHESVGVFCLQP